MVPGAGTRVTLNRTLIAVSIARRNSAVAYDFRLVQSGLKANGHSQIRGAVSWRGQTAADFPEGDRAMSEILYSIGYVLSASTIAAGLALLVLHLWALANKLGNDRTHPIARSSPPQSRGGLEGGK